MDNAKTEAPQSNVLLMPKVSSSRGATHQSIVDRINKKHNLTGKGREELKKKHMLHICTSATGHQRTSGQHSGEAGCEAGNKPRFLEAGRCACKHRTSGISRQDAGIEITEAEKTETRLVVGLYPMDLRPILYWELTKEGHSDTISPIAPAFTSEKIMEAHHKLGFDPYNRARLTKPRP